MAKMTKGTSGAKTAGASKQYLQLGGVSVDPNRPKVSPSKETRQEKRANRKEVRKTMKDIKSGKYGPVDNSGKFQMGGSATKADTSKLREYLKDYSSDPSLPPGFKKMKPSKRKVNPNDVPYKKKGGMVKKQNGGGIDFKKASEMFKPKSKTYNSEDIKKTLPGVKSESPSGKPKGASSKGSPIKPIYKQKGGMTKSKKK